MKGGGEIGPASDTKQSAIKINVKAMAINKLHCICIAFLSIQVQFDATSAHWPPTETHNNNKTTATEQQLPPH